MGRSRWNIALGIGVTVALLLALVGMAGPPATLAAGTDTAVPCDFGTLQSAVEGVGDGQTAIFDVAPNCTLTADDINDTITVHVGANVTIHGQGLTLDDGTAQGPGGVEFFTVGDHASLSLDHLTLENGSEGIDAFKATSPTISVNASTISDNDFEGIFAFGATSPTVTVTDSTVSHNGAYGIETSTASSSTIAVISSTISGNALYGILATLANSPTITVISSTISGNVLYGIDASSATSATITVTASTIRNNDYGIDAEAASSPTITVTASILADSGIDNCVGTIIDGGYNISASADGADDSCGFSTSTKRSENVTDAQLALLNDGALGDYGGPTQTIALGAASSAIDAIPVYLGQCTLTAGQSDPITDPTTGDPLTTDQRGVARPQDSGCDIGAFERTTSLTLGICRRSPAQPDYVAGPQSWYGENVTSDCDLIDDAASPTAIFDTAVRHTILAPGAAAPSASLTDVACDGATCSQLTITATRACLVDSSTCVSLPSGSVAVDLQAPTITSPAAGQVYTLNQTVPLSCSDGDGSGVASCSGPQTVDTSTLGQHTYTVTATDNVGNTATKQVSYSVGYALTPLPGNTATVHRGYYAVIRFAPEDANGHDYARRNLRVTSIELDGPSGQQIPFAHPFQFGRFSGQKGYQLTLNTRNLTRGDWALAVTIGRGQTALIQTITFTVE